WRSRPSPCCPQSPAGRLRGMSTAAAPLRRQREENGRHLVRGDEQWRLGKRGRPIDATEAAIGRAVESIRRWPDMPIDIQLAHAGRKASTEVPWKGGAQLPRRHSDFLLRTLPVVTNN